jgi:cell division cycle 14
LDFGPLNFGHLYRFITKLNHLYDQYPDRILVYYSSMDPCKRANATYLISAWRLLVQNLSPVDAIRGLDCTSIPPFHDASPGPCTYKLTILDCLRGIDKARRFRFFHWDQFDITEYEHYEQVEVRK